MVYIKSVISYKKGAWLKLRERVKPSPIKRELCAEFNDTSHKGLLQMVQMLWKGALFKHRGRAKPSPMKEEVSAEFNDTSHKGIP